MTDRQAQAFLPRALAGEYEFLAFLKEGRQRQTMLLRNKANGRQVVLKRSRDGSEDLAEELRLLRQVAGDGVPVGLDGFQEDGCSYLLREYVPGESLLDYAQKRMPLPAGEVREIGLALCRILKRCHSQDPPVIHRDIKPENIIRAGRDRYVLIDFGIARRYDAAARRDTRVLGTPASAPPEQFGYRQTDARSDVYALGVLLHELATGEQPLDRGTMEEPLRSIAGKCTRFDPDDRYPDAAAVEQALLGRPKRRLRPAALCILLAALLALAGLAWRFSRRPSGDGAYRFASAAIEREVCRQLDKEPGTVMEADLEGITHLFLCGGQNADRWDQISMEGKNLYLDGAPVTASGGVDTAEDLAHMPNLRELALCGQQLRDLTPLGGCAALERLALTNNQIADLGPLSACEQLRELFVGGNPVSDLSPLAGCGQLWRLDAGATALTSLDSLAGLTSLYELWLHDVEGLGDISALTELPHLDTLFLRPVRAGQLETIGDLTELKNLFFWHGEGMTDLTALASLDELHILFIHQADLSSLAGAECMTSLQRLTVLSSQPLSLTPLEGLTELIWLDLTQASVEDWTPLRELEALEEVLCGPQQAERLREQLGEPPFRLTVS